MTDSYLTNLIERDVSELAMIERRSDLRRYPPGRRRADGGRETTARSA
jgi:hypothetical protein